MARSISWKRNWIWRYISYAIYILFYILIYIPIFESGDTEIIEPDAFAVLDSDPISDEDSSSEDEDEVHDSQLDRDMQDQLAAMMMWTLDLIYIYIYENTYKFH